MYVHACVCLMYVCVRGRPRGRARPRTQLATQLHCIDEVDNRSLTASSLSCVKNESHCIGIVSSSSQHQGCATLPLLLSGRMFYAQPKQLTQYCVCLGIGCPMNRSTEIRTNMGECFQATNKIADRRVL